MASEGLSEAGWEGRGGTQRPGGRAPSHGAESATAGIHGPSSVLSSLKALWHVVGAVSTHQIRVDFWECLVVSGGREARCWMQEAASKVWSLEQGDLMPEP